MSRETLQDLNLNTLIGFTDKRGNAWHYRAELQGDEPNHYPGPVPVADVQRRLFHWHAVEGPVNTTLLTEDGVTTITDESRKAIIRPDLKIILGLFKDGYQIHQYDEWLLQNVANILDDDLGIGSAILLKQGAVAAVSVEVPENITTPEGVEFRPNLLATTSLDGSFATTYKRVVTNVVCDNTHDMAMAEQGQTYKVKHTRYSNLKITEARDALAIVHTIADDFADEVATLCSIDVSRKAWGEFLDVTVPLPNEPGRGLTMAQNKRDALTRLYRADPRVSPWEGTAWGVVQAVNTWVQHEQAPSVKGTARAERNTLLTLRGGTDTETLGSLFKVLQAV